MTEILVHRIIEGPFHSSEVTDDIDGDYEGDFYFCQALVEVGGGVSEEEVRFDGFKELYKTVTHLKYSIDPYVLEAEAF